MFRFIFLFILLLLQFTPLAQAQTHWSFQPRGIPAVPTITDAAAKAWTRTSVDAFILAKLRASDIEHADFFDFWSLTKDLTGYDACFFCLGVSSAGMSEQRYTRITYDITLAAAQTLVKLNPEMVFIYVSGMGTDSTEKGRTMWARVKGQTENALLQLPFKAAYMFRPGWIQPLHGITSRTPLYRAIYAVAGPLYPLLKAAFPNSVTTTEQIGRAMIHVAEHGAAKRILEVPDINAA